MIKRILCLVMALLMICTSLVACNNEGKTQLLSFSQAQSIEEMEKLDGKTVSIIGYMSTLSPVSGKFMYLMNLPYQSCPFCIPNTTQLSNTMAVYAKDEFEFTNRAIQVTGLLEFGEFEDEFGYQYGYRIKDATYSILDTSNMSEELKLWQQLASTDAVAEVYTMFDYTYFLCKWPTYTMEFQSGQDYLHAPDAIMFVETEGYQFNYGFKEGYFDGIINSIESVNKTAFAELVDIIRDSEALADRAYEELKAGNYTKVSEYSDVFNDGRIQYKMDLSKELEEEWQRIYLAFSDWLSGWEL